MSIPKSSFALSSAALAALVLTSCSPNASAEPPAPGPSAGASVRAEGGTGQVEVSALAPRAVLTYNGGIMTLNTKSGEVVANAELDGLLRLNHTGDGRHLLVSAGNEFRIFDSGLIAEGHGDHDHYYEQAPAMTGDSIEAAKAAHVTTHGGKTALFADGSGAISVLKSAAFQDGKVGEDEVQQFAAESPHHGVAVPLSSGDLLLTQGTEASRSTIQVKSPAGRVLAETTDCPGVHGEAAAEPTAGGDVVALGCENGPVIYREGAFHKVPVKEEYQRSGNLFGVDGSPVVLADYKVDADAEKERPTRIALINTVETSMQTVDLGSPYWYRSLARGTGGEALVLTYDGELNILEAETGRILHEVTVVEPWEEPADPQVPGPAVKVGADGLAYVTDAAAKKLHVVDVGAGTVRDSIELPETPIELALVTGESGGSSHPGREDHPEGR